MGRFVKVPLSSVQYIYLRVKNTGNIITSNHEGFLN